MIFDGAENDEVIFRYFVSMHLAIADYEMKQTSEFIQRSLFFFQKHTADAIHHQLQFFSPHLLNELIQNLILNNQNKQIMHCYLGTLISFIFGTSRSTLNDEQIYCFIEHVTF